jgi:hypothetical protein
MTLVSPAAGHATATVATDGGPSRSVLVRTFVLTLLATLAAQAAWILVVPPFRGMDEHDHAYRAADVAHGDWSRHHAPSTERWGLMVYVPPGLVEAATPICESLPYTTGPNCHAGPTRADGLAPVASSASQYNPVFYAVIGTVARPFDGYAALYAMRIGGALMCALLVAVAATTLRLWSRSVWAQVGLMAALSPTMIYSTGVAAPNGIEMCAGLVVWCALLGLPRAAGRPAMTRTLVYVATAGALPLVTVRTLGPLWLLAIVATCLLLVRRADLAATLRRPYVWGCSALVLAATLVAAWWTLTAGTNSIVTDTKSFDDPLPGVIASNLVLWCFQAMAAFPARDEIAPMGLFAVGLIMWWVVAAAAVRLGLRRERWVLLVLVLATLAIPAAFTAATYASQGPIWQGRYGYPYSMGILLLCGVILDRRAAASLRGTSTRRGPLALSWTSWAVVAVTAAYTIIQAVGAVWVLLRQGARSPLSGTGHWVQPEPWVVVALVLGSGIMLAWSVLLSRHRDELAA